MSALSSVFTSSDNSMLRMLPLPISCNYSYLLRLIFPSFFHLFFFCPLPSFFHLSLCVSSYVFISTESQSLLLSPLEYMFTFGPSTHQLSHSCPVLLLPLWNPQRGFMNTSKVWLKPWHQSNTQTGTQSFSLYATNFSFY